MRLLLVEDDALLSGSLRKELERVGFAVDLAENGIDAEYMGNEVEYDLVILDIGLPEKNGLEVLSGWRNHHNRVPVLILTARDAWHERVEGFRTGADDYLGKPFHVEELIARVKALIHRSHGMPGARLAVGGLELDEEEQKVILADGEIARLTGTEFRLLRYFMMNPNKVLSKTRLTEHVYQQDFDRDSNVIEVYIRRLRDTVGKERIITRRGQGYLFITDGQ